MRDYVPKRRGRGEGLYAMSRILRDAALAFLLLFGAIYAGERLAHYLLTWSLP